VKGSTVAICRYGAGNVRSVELALGRLGAELVDDVAGADLAILPGVGSARSAMEGLKQRGVDLALRERHAAGRPILGICLGLQLLFDSSTELGGADGLGLFGGEVAEIDAEGLKVPHIGWAPVRWERESRLTEGIESETPFYFVHSFAPRPAAGELLGSAPYGERFACAAERDNVFGVQFHPEKSSAAGLRLLANFAGVCAAVPA
jgi:glutamine amidotransferase